MYNFLISILYNKKENRYHPIIFSESPLPSAIEQDIVRYKSRGHHTEGFESIDDAKKSCSESRERAGEGVVIDKVFEWDGEDIPAMIILVDKKNNIII